MRTSDFIFWKKKKLVIFSDIFSSAIKNIDKYQITNTIFRSKPSG
jgi:hypothetical protein